MASRPIWQVTPHLCGDASWNQLLLALKVYSDESGKGDSVAFVMAGIIARAEQWPDFDNDWRGMLAMPPAIPAFHMVDIVAKRDFARLHAAAEIIRKHHFTVVAVMIFMPDFEMVLKGRISRAMDTPYFPACQMIMEQALQWEIDHGIDEPIDFIFDEQLHESDYLQSIWTPLVNSLPAELRRRFGRRPIHADDTQYPALQAADLFAWSLRRIAVLAVESKMPDAFLHTIFNGVPMRHINWTADKMVAFLEYIKRRNTELGRLTFHEFAEAAQNKDILYAGFNRDAITKTRSGEIVSLASIPAKGIGRFLLVDRCPHQDIPHLHRRSGDQCLVALGK